MKVLGHKPQAWYLLEEGDGLYLDVLCSNSFFIYEVLIALNDEERGRYASEGRNYLSRLAHEIHSSVPGSVKSNSPYKDRNLGGNRGLSQTVSAAISVWQSLEQQSS
jgi:hypothetical protein